MPKFFLLATLLLLVSGCNRQGGPKPLSLEEIPAALSNAFKPARLLVRQNAESIAKQVVDKQYASATIQLQVLLPQELTKPQREVASASLLTLNQILQEQAASAQSPESDQPANTTVKQPASPEEAAAAAAVMQNYIRTK